VIHVQLTEPGIYQYYCEPPWSELVADPRCKCTKDKEKKRARAVQPVAKPREQKKTTTAAPRPRAHLYLEEVDPAFRELTRRIPAREAAPGEEYFVLVDSDLYKKSVQQEQAEQLTRQTRLMQIDPRRVPFVQLSAPLIPIAMIAGAIELPIVAAVLVAGIVAAAPEEAAVGVGAAAAEGVAAATATTEVAAGAAATTEVAAGAAATTEAAAAAGAEGGGQVISLSARLAARAAATSSAITSQQAAAAAAALVATGIPAQDAAAATQPLIGKRLISVLRAPSSAAAYKLGEVVDVSGQKFTVVMRIGVK
jgi:hypothetical protein